MNSNLSCAHRPHQTSASREPSSLHRSCGPLDRCALSTHGNGRWAMAMLSGQFECSPAAVAANVRASARSTAGCKVRAHCIAPTDRADVPLRSVQHPCMICLCLALGCMLRSTCYLYRYFARNLERSACEKARSHSCAAVFVTVRRAARYSDKADMTSFMCGARFERRFQCQVCLTQPHFPAPLTWYCTLVLAVHYLSQLSSRFSR